MELVYRPWGWYQNIYDADKTYKVKRLFVSSHQKISLQYHLKRSEHWIVVDGNGTLTLDGVVKTIKVGDYVYIPLESIHRIEGGDTGILIIEIQQGSLCVEDDIIRLEDDYQRI